MDHTQDRVGRGERPTLLNDKETAKIQGYATKKRHQSNVPFWSMDSVSYNVLISLWLGFSRAVIHLDQSWDSLRSEFFQSIASCPVSLSCLECALKTAPSLANHTLPFPQHWSLPVCDTRKGGSGDLGPLFVNHWNAIIDEVMYSACNNWLNVQTSMGDLSWMIGIPGYKGYTGPALHLHCWNAMNYYLQCVSSMDSSPANNEQGIFPASFIAK